MRPVAAKFVPRLPTRQSLSMNFFTKHETTVVPPAAQLYRFGPCGFFLIPKWKSSLKVRRFLTVEEIEENSMRDLRAFPQNTFQDAFREGKKRWERCIKS